MVSPNDRPGQDDAARLLQSVAQESEQMVKTSGNPRGLLTIVVAVSAVVFTLIQFRFLGERKEK